MNAEDLLSREIFWHSDSKDPAMYFAEVDGEKVQLRLNDFPDEIACTLFLNSGAFDIDDFGKKWRLQK